MEYVPNSETIKNSWNYGLFYAPRQQCRIAYKLCTLFYFIASRESGIMFYTRSYPLILYKPLNWKNISFRKIFRNTYMSNTLYFGMWMEDNVCCIGCMYMERNTEPYYICPQMLWQYFQRFQSTCSTKIFIFLFYLWE